MAEKNKSYRIRTTVGREADSFLEVHLDQDYDSLEILSLKISDKDTYKLHNSDYGVVVGRVLANGNFGVPNAKISVFIPADEQNSNMEMWNLYPYSSTSVKNDKDIRYNLLPDESVKDCHKAVGTFPHKTYLLENDALLEVFDAYYLYTTRTNAAGDYLICGVPTGMQTLHMDLDLSDCGILSQRPRDFVYKGYTIEQFDNPNQFKKDENIDSLAQIFSQDQPVYVQPFWGNEGNGEEIGITRADIQISFKFEPTCVFMGSAISDNASNGVGKKCVPTNQMGVMDELTAGEGTIEMIRKTPAGNVEEFSIKGNQLINGNGVWCYQIPMNLDYMMTDEYGNMVPTDDPEKGIPTRTRVRFRASLTDMEGSSQSYYRAKYLIPNNPGIDDQKVDYDFGTYTDEDSYRDLFWNGVYTVKSYIPRFQKSKRWKNERFSGVKACNYYGGNNPMPYNNMRIKLPFMFTVLCIFVKLFIKITALINRIIAGVLKVIAGVIGVIFTPLRWIGRIFLLIGKISKGAKKIGQKLIDLADGAVSAIINPFIKSYGIHCTFIGDGLCPDMEGWYFAPGCTMGNRFKSTTQALMVNTLAAAKGSGADLEDMDKDLKKEDPMNSDEFTDETSVDNQNTSSSEEDSVCLTRDVNYLLSCFEMNLAQEYRVIKFDFYNDWVNGVLYFPRWMRKVKRKKKYKFSLKKGDKFITTYYKDKVQGCMNADNSTVKKSRYYTQQCSLGYKSSTPNRPWTEIGTGRNCYGTAKTGTSIIPSKCHKKQGMSQSPIFGKKSGLVTEETTMLGQNVYYLKPCEWNNSVRTLLFATDIVLLGTLNDCDENGIPQSFKFLNNSSYIMPTNLALTTMDDDAFIYAAGDGTVCSSGSKKGVDDDLVPSRVTPNFESTNKAYANTDGDAVDYGENDDPIPVTESAGISWNYSGPGQDDVNLGILEKSKELIKRLFGGGKSKYDYLYYPGGHFLGLSCVNSDSNIKSCVNLKRICELGATMSQRREELMGYSDNNGKPKAEYRYYVPTGLISNVDIEGASFRSMFATMNHNRLVATLNNEATGYKKYNFRFLRPDGFDGSLFKYVHEEGSPYNKVVNDTDNPKAITDSSKFFKNVFPDWDRPLDYDEKEVERTERRTVESSIDDYYMFRLGLNTFADKEQRKHYLRKEKVGYLFPQYENSFYFYFGLKDGSTALDEFKKQFFSECESNNVMRTPSVSVIEKISEQLVGSATIIIDNMLSPYTIILKDNTIGVEYDAVTVSEDSVNFTTLSHGVAPVISHNYTVTVTDSVDQVAQKNFVFGASAVKIDAETVNFRKPGDSRANNPREGGFIKINDEILILKRPYYISDTSHPVSFKYRKIVNGIPQGDGSTLNEGGHYANESDELMHLYYMPSIGIYEILIQYNGNTVSVYTATVDDNKRINLFASCDYLAYKKELGTDGNFKPCIFNDGLKTLSESDWYNGSKFIGADWTNWLMRHSFYRQTENDNLAYDNFIYTKGKTELAIFGQPESGNTVKSAGLLGVGMDVSGGSRPNNYSNDYGQFVGYLVDDEYTYIPTMYFNPETDEEEDRIFRNAFDAMAYTDDGRAAADASNAVINSYSYGNGIITLNYTGGDEHVNKVGHGCVVVLENGTILFPVVTSVGTMVAYSPNVYEGVSNDILNPLMEMATVYPTMRVPSVYKPFYGVVSAATWNVQDLIVGSTEDGKAVPEIETLPLSYKIEGNVYNGLTFNDHFYSGETITDDNGETYIAYETYMMFNKGANANTFWRDLTEQDITGSLDWQCNRKLLSNKRFGQNSWSASNFGFGREIVNVSESESAKDVTNVEYRVTEGYPTNIPASVSGNVFTERYNGGFDKTILSDSVDSDKPFYSELQIKVLKPESGLTGPCVLYTEGDVPNTANTEVYISKTEFFDKSQSPLSISENGTFCYGTYNHNAKFDAKGTMTSVRDWALGYRFSITNENGTKLDKSTANERTLYDSGVTLLHQYTLKTRFKRDINQINTELADLSVTRLTKVFTKKDTIDQNEAFTVEPDTSLNTYKTVICVYTKPADGTRNKMIVYRLYSLGALSVVYPPETDGVAPYMNVSSTEYTYGKDAQACLINVSTNVKFTATIEGDCGWITIQTPQDGYSPTNSTLQFDITKNETGSGRTGQIRLKCTEEGVEIEDIVITINQTKDDVQELGEKVTEMEGQIEDLTTPTSEGE